MEGRIRIVSGGQTGVDRGALEAALEARIPCGGWCPAGRRDELGIIPARYPVLSLKTGSWRRRTIRNVIESDGTAVVTVGPASGGTAETLRACRCLGKPWILVDASSVSFRDAAVRIWRFVEENRILTLNVAGPRASEWPEAESYAKEMIGEMLRVSSIVPSRLRS